MSRLYWELRKAMSRSSKGNARDRIVTGFKWTGPGWRYDGTRYGKTKLHTFPKGKVGYGYWCRRSTNRPGLL